MSLAQNIKNGTISGSGFTAAAPRNTPRQYADRQFPYYGDETERFTEQYAKYASDYVTAEIQIFQPDGTFIWKSTKVRFANIVRPSAAISRNFDDYKIVLFADADIDYVQPGAKLVTMGSTWLAYNPDNVSSVVANGIFKRCNAVWNFLDYYGNVVSEPMCVENARANANAPDSEHSMVVMTGYFNVLCQYNANTAQIDDNTRMVLGSKTYMVSGYSDFQTEFTGDYSSVRTVQFALRTEEKNAANDDMVRHIAGGLDFSWNIILSGAASVGAGQSTAFEAISQRNGKTVLSTQTNPITYLWTSSDPGSVSVTSDGTVTGITAGAVATIRATLAQNPEIWAERSVTVDSGAQALAFTQAPPERLAAYHSATVSAAVSGVPDAVVSFAFSGAAIAAYTTTVTDNSVDIACWGGSDIPLTVTASWNDQTISADIVLEGL